MKVLTLACFAAAQLTLTSAFAQKKTPENWFNLDPKKDKVYGVGTERTYNELIKDKAGRPVIVAVIDGGTDPLHEDLKDVMWKNPKEVEGNGIDDDHNGYVDDIYGWNFIGGKDGSNVNHDNLEVTRVYARLKSKYDKADSNTLSRAEKIEYYNYLDARGEYFRGKQEGTTYSALYGNIVKGIGQLKKGIGKSNITMTDVKAYKPAGQNEAMAQSVVKQSFKKLSANDTVPFETLISGLRDAQEHYEKDVKYSYNADLDTRKIVGDNYDDGNERNYGNADVKGPSAAHGTHVAGIIAAVRNNNIGMKGVAQNVKIMAVRVVPDGDERDKDVANGIRYAVDNGATVINMSFGKAFSYNKKLVDDAVKYAMSKDVLLVHAAGNDSKDNDIENNFPNPYFDNDRSAGAARATGWIEIGASAWQKSKELAATFSNYGKTSVDVFAPGVQIYSTTPDSHYGTFDGTSMAAPVTSGVAAVLRSYYPQLTAVQVREVIMKSVVPVRKKVYIPGQTKKKTKLKELSATGGVVNLYQAFKLAEDYKK